MATELASTYKKLVNDVRVNLLEPQPKFWSDDELFIHLVNGTKDLWRSIIDLHAGHFSTIDNVSMTLPINSSQIAGVPNDLFRVLMIEPKDLSQSSQTRGVTFLPRKYNTIEFQGARGLDAKDPGQFPIIFYDVMQAGPPTGAPLIVVAPQITTAVKLNVQYVPALPKLKMGDMNPIPGASDLALVAWATAYAFGKQPVEGDGKGIPDPAWLTIYKAEKDHILTAITPRQEQEPEVVEGIFDYY